MSLGFGPERVIAPDGVEWRVGRRWPTRRFGWAWKRRGIASEAISGLGQGIGGVDLQGGALVVVGALAVLLILIPLLFFGLELIVLGALLAAGVAARVVLRQPWLIQARSSDPLTAGRRLEWRVVGWRKSHKLIQEVVSDLAAGREPPQSTLAL
jgi:hypothetical protein